MTQAMTPIIPLLVACAWATMVLLIEAFSSSRRFVGVAWLTVVGLAVVAALSMQPAGDGAVYGNAIAMDGYAAYFNVLACVIGIGSVLLSVDYLHDAGIFQGEYYPLMFFAVAGVVVMAAATDLIVMFIGLETMSMAVYVLAGSLKNQMRSNEASLKYFLLGAFASALLLYGIALLYVMTGTTVLGGMHAALTSGTLAGSDHLVVVLGTGLVLIGLGFKIAAVPFHLWAPDVYEGAPTSVTAFMATAVKAGGFAALLRTAMIALAPLHEQMMPILWVAAAVTMTVGNLVALRQASLKRMLAYSSIAHTGYLLVGVTAGTDAAGAAVLFYLAGYGAMNLVAFGIMCAVARRGDARESIADYAGLGQTNPMLALAMTIAMLSLTGIPPLGGFIGKLYVFTAALDAGLFWLVGIAVFNSVISAAYYLGVVRTMYFDPPAGGVVEARPYAAVVVAAATVVTVLLGVAPAPVLAAAARAFEKVVLGA
ncbi:MAG TPA: NADH-quinone oxidoreductase subunit N [Candidatus Binatia bacterium]|nr:NADH-quinone oxidoreductase subunit N [Candidatus Binatia bacterium]